MEFLQTAREKATEVLKSAGEVAKKGAVIALSGVIAVGCAVPVASAAADDIIDTTKTGTMHIRKYDMTAAQEGGVDLNQFIANGEQDPDAEEALAKYELEGVQFSPTFAGEIATYSQEGTVILTYSIPATLRNILELSASDAIWSSGDKLYYTSTQLNDAMQEGLRDNTNFKNKLDAGINVCNKMNNHWRWVTFCIDDDGDVAASIDSYVDDFNCGELCMNLVRRMVNIIDEAYPDIARALWA
jgi:hypothetical protein